MTTGSEKKPRARWRLILLLPLIGIFYYYLKYLHDNHLLGHIPGRNERDLSPKAVVHRKRPLRVRSPGWPAQLGAETPRKWTAIESLRNLQTDYKQQSQLQLYHCYNHDSYLLTGLNGLKAAIVASAVRVISLVAVREVPIWAKPCTPAALRWMAWQAPGMAGSESEPNSGEYSKMALSLDVMTRGRPRQSVTGTIWEGGKVKSKNDNEQRETQEV